MNTVDSARYEPAARSLETARLRLTALDPSDAAAMVSVLADPELHVFTGDTPPALDRLEARYRAQVAGPSDPGERWLNWIVRLAETSRPIGFVQATVVGRRADVAWLIGSEWQGQGFAREAAAAMCEWLRRMHDVTHITAHIHPDHQRSAGVAAALGLRPSGEVDDDGEQIWLSADEPSSAKRGSEL